MRVLELFAGAGGFSIGLERAVSEGPYTGFETVAFCEIEPFPRKVLAKNWPGVPCYDDVRTLTAERLAADGIAVDGITGGFPCQDVSSAGVKRGMGEGTRSGLYSEVIRLAGDLRPKFIILENVTGLLSGPSEQPGAWFGRVLSDLAGIGYDAEWEVIPASAVGGIHPRGRVWIMAYPNGERLEGLRPFFGINETTSAGLSARRLQINKTNYDGICGSVWTADAGRIFGVRNGLPDRPRRLKLMGNAVVPKIPELIGHAILESMAA